MVKLLIISILTLAILLVFVVIPGTAVALQKSDNFVCIDAACWIKDYFSHLGINSEIVWRSGILTSHAWLKVDFGFFIIAYDWGIPSLRNDGIPYDINTLPKKIYERIKERGDLD